MKSHDVKKRLEEILDEGVNGMGEDEVLRLMRRKLDLIEKQRQPWAKPNDMKPWRDEELEVVLSAGFSKAEIIWLARLFGRSYDAILVIKQWPFISEERADEVGFGDNSFVRQIRRVYRKL